MIPLGLIIGLAMLPGIALADGWDAYGPDGSYQDHIGGESERGLPAVLGAQDVGFLHMHKFKIIVRLTDHAAEKIF